MHNITKHDVKSEITRKPKEKNVNRNKINVNIPLGNIKEKIVRCLTDDKKNSTINT